MTRDELDYESAHETSIHVIEHLGRQLAEARKDSQRLDALERAIRDGSYASIFGDIIAVCEHSYRTLGPGSALRTAIDGAIAESAP